MASSLMNTRSVSEIQNLLLCHACEKTINEPKILSCSHSFCKACIDNLPREVNNVSSEDTKLNCPTCRATTTLKPNETVAELPNNEFILELLSAIGPNGNQTSATCSHCQKQPSITICVECEMLLCHECYIQHESWPRNKKHAMLSLSEIINSDREIGAGKLSCTQHEDVIPKFYCDTCKELICIKCMASAHPKPGHVCVPIHEIYRQQLETVKSKYSTIKAMLEEGNKVSRYFDKTYERGV